MILAAMFFSLHRDAINVRSELKENASTSGVKKKMSSERNDYAAFNNRTVVSRGGLMNTSFVKVVTCKHRQRSDAITSVPLRANITMRRKYSFS